MLDNALAVSQNIDPMNVIVTILASLAGTVLMIGLCGGLIFGIKKCIGKLKKRFHDSAD